jgi:hypothetical protein
VDDSAVFFRQSLSSLISETRTEVMGTAGDPYLALKR